MSHPRESRWLVSSAAAAETADAGGMSLLTVVTAPAGDEVKDAATATVEAQEACITTLETGTNSQEAQETVPTTLETGEFVGMAHMQFHSKVGWHR